MNEKPVASPLERAIIAAGSQSALARLLSVSQHAVWQWSRKCKPLPAKHVLKVEFATGVSRHDLRPDLYPLPTDIPAALNHTQNLLPVRGCVAFNSTSSLPPEPAND